jgi:ferredoxin
MLVINPDECIDCGVCVPECPADAIVADVDLPEPDRIIWMERNAKYSMVWPNIDSEQDPMKDHELYDGLPNKFEQYVEIKNV